MRLSRFLLLSVAAVAVTACSSDDGVTVNARPPLGGVRFIHAVPDYQPVDIRMVDQVQWSASSVTTSANYGLPYRFATIHWATEAKPRHIRVFPTDSSATVTSTILVDTTITIEANKNVTLMLVRNADGNLGFVTINDDVPSLSTGQIGARVVNAGNAAQLGAVDGYFTATATTDISAATPTFASVAPYSASQYEVRSTGAFAARVTPAGVNTSVYSAGAPAGAVAVDGKSPIAGSGAALSGLSAYIFPRACPTVTEPISATNCPAAKGQSSTTITAYNSPTVIWFVDQIPPPVTVGSSS
jgi:hypothetical protein